MTHKTHISPLPISQQPADKSVMHYSESLLHKKFKEYSADYITAKIANNEDIAFKWHCHKCHEEHEGKLSSSNIVKVVTEHDLRTCRPDIALLDQTDKVIAVIEIVATHPPQANAMKYYKKHNILCLQIKINDTDCCDIVAEKLSNPDKVNIPCPNPKCEKCGCVMNNAKIVTTIDYCWHCGEEMVVAMLIPKNKSDFFFPSAFNEQEIDIATILGAKIEEKYSKTQDRKYNANVCKHCGNFIGEFYIHNYWESPYKHEIDLDYYKCFNCLHTVIDEENE